MDACLFLHTKRLDCRIKVNSCLSSLVPSRSKEYKKCFGGGLNFKILIGQNGQNYFSCIFRLVRGKGGKMAAGSEAVSYLLEAAQKRNLVEVFDLLHQAVQDLHSQVEAFTEESEIVELTKALENCSNIYSTYERLMKGQVHKLTSMRSPFTTTAWNYCKNFLPRTRRKLMKTKIYRKSRLAVLEMCSGMPVGQVEGSFDSAVRWFYTEIQRRSAVYIRGWYWRTGWTESSVAGC